MKRKIRVLIVDDSNFMRKMLTDMIISDPDCELIYAAKDGLEALKAIKQLKPDVVTMDIELPEIDGITCVAYIMREFPTPVIVITGFSQYMGEETILAMQYGAVDFIKKPNGCSDSQNMEEMGKELLSKIRLASKVDVRKLKLVVMPEEKKRGESLKMVKPEKTIGISPTNRVVALAGSSGGPGHLALSFRSFQQTFQPGYW
ncbi:MAG: response regulator [Candidatus Desantisbacteria bacterium]